MTNQFPTEEKRLRHLESVLDLPHGNISDYFAEQVAANHPAPSGAQIATSAPLVVDARVNVADVAATQIAAVEGRVTSFDVSDEANIDARKPSGLYLIMR